jgi:hypothetical protein
MKHTMQLKTHSGSKFAATLMRTGGAYVIAYADYTFQPVLPSKWTTPDQFEAIWIGDRP